MPRHLWSALILPLLLFAACGATTTSAPTATSTTSPAPTAIPATSPTAAPVSCASALPGAGAINLSLAGFVYPYAFPTGSTGTTPAISAQGSGLFTVERFNACSPHTTAAQVQSFFANTMTTGPHAWTSGTTFPADGALLTSCLAPCFWNAKGGPIYSFAVDSFADHGNGVITYRVRWAHFELANLPQCSANFTSGPPAA